MRQLQALIRAGMALNSRLSLDQVLQTLVDSAREVIKARYAALGVLDSSGKSLSRFLHSAIDPETVIRIGRWPTGGGTLGIMLRDVQTVRMPDMHQHGDFAGFPEGHPSMRSLLGVPIRIGNRVFGNLYLTEKIGADEFSAEDEELAELLAAQAAVAVENAELAEQRSQFLAIVNHEIKNAAAGVVGWTDRLRKLTDHADGRVREGASYASEGAQQLHRLVVDLLDLSRIEARQLELDFRGADLRALIREVAATVRPTAERQEIELRVSGLDKRTIVQTDGTRVRQILLNLLSNALKFTTSGGQVDLELAPSDKGWAVTVRDTGPGVDPAVGDRVFEAYRAGTFKVPQSGAGLGLAISRELARLLGGELSHADGDGPGAHFRLWLPAKPPTAARHGTQS
jgi:signal transduction histidine kinase